MTNNPPKRKPSIKIQDDPVSHGVVDLFFGGQFAAFQPGINSQITLRFAATIIAGPDEVICLATNNSRRAMRPIIDSDANDRVAADDDTPRRIARRNENV